MGPSWPSSRAVSTARSPARQAPTTTRGASLPAASALIVANGVQGTYLHWRGIAQRPGGMTKYNMESGPPAVAPLLASLVGGMGLLASLLRREDLPADGRR